MSKNIAVFSDGTGQEGGKSNNSNVYRLFNMVRDRSPNQIAFYDRGLGTGFRKLTGNGAGMGISKNIKECYEFLFNNFEASDQIYLFGFSRGATTVRSLSGFIQLFGILPKSRPELIDQAWKIYRIRNRTERIAKAKDFVDNNHTMWTRIKFVGVWDTVAALGVPFKVVDNIVNAISLFRHRFHDLTLTDSIENAFHALAVDDQRLTFHPTLWSATELKSYQQLKQVWFCGMHTDVGGGYEEAELSDITLKWMVTHATDNGLLIYPHNAVEAKMNPKANGLMHDSRGGTFSKYFRKKERFWPEGRSDEPCVHQSVLDRQVHIGRAYLRLH